ncbi:MAG: acyl-CoA dehydrogenase [Desulfobacteraceae bacterium]|nr:acyl-CoA dehydrogenase [Desulfobacteraceae bacterium]
MASDIYFNKDHHAVRMAVREFVNKRINPYVDEWEKNGFIPLHQVFKQMGELGFLGIRYDLQYGGEGLDYWYECIFYEEFAHIKGCSLPLAAAVQISMATPAIYEFGSEYLKETYLKPALKGEKVAAIAVTEPGAGSDVSAICTTAAANKDHYILNGSKTYITNGAQADFLTLLARTSDEPGYHSFSLFVVPTDLPGFSAGPKMDKLGMRASDTAELFFDNMKIPAQNLIGKQGEGFIYQMKQFQHERFAVLPLAYTLVRDMADITVEHLKNRVAFAKPLIAKQVLRHRLAGYLAQAESLQQLTYHIIRMKMAGQDVTKQVSMGKLIAGDLIIKAAGGCLQMFGGSGFINDTLISRYYRDVRLLSIGGGASEVMSDIIAKTSGF